jgi:hypothetical protein
MNNHYHIVVRIDSAEPKSWTDQEVVERWTQLFSGREHVRRWLRGDELQPYEMKEVFSTIAIWRHRLNDLSWFMRCLNEPIARMANEEDNCTGRFWEGRFTSQALLGEKALLACMAYVDLNPIRANMARTPENSDFTSIQERIRKHGSTSLRAFAGRGNDDTGLPYNLHDYLEFVDWAGRAMQKGKRGYIPQQTPPILARLSMETTPVLDYLKKKEEYSPVALGPASLMRDYARAVGKRFVKGLAMGGRLCPEPG